MINALVVEDEVAAAQRLVKMIREVEPSISIVNITDSISSTVKWLSDNPEPNLVFLDIHLADGSSFKIFEKISIKCPIIFTTAYDQYAIQAFKLNSIDYLLKPIKREELAFSINKFKDSKPNALDVSLLIKEIKKQQEPNWQKRFIVQFADKLKSIDIEEVAYFMAYDKCVFLASKTGVNYAIDYTMDKLESVLDPSRFFRINRKFIVSFESIKLMHYYSKSRVKIDLDPKPDVDVIVSTERSSGFKEWLNK
jgi:two-component system, LytTR family, response regulator LytT